MHFQNAFKNAFLNALFSANSLKSAASPSVCRSLLLIKMMCGIFELLMKTCGTTRNRSDLHLKQTAPRPRETNIHSDRRIGPGRFKLPEWNAETAS